MEESEIDQSVQEKTQKIQSYLKDNNFQGLSKTLSKETLVQKLKKANIKGLGLGKKLIVLNKDGQQETDNSILSKPNAKK